MKRSDFIAMLHKAVSAKTLYVMGCFGAPMTAANKIRYKSNHTYNMASDRKAMIDAAGVDTFGFDCVCLIKGILWGWNGDISKSYGGAVYKSNGVPDVDTSGMLSYCNDVTACAGCESIIPGEYLYMQGHCGIYIGEGNVIECSPRWANGVQITSYTARKWLKHGKLKFIDYSGTLDIDVGEKNTDFDKAQEINNVLSNIETSVSTLRGLIGIPV